MENSMNGVWQVYDGVIMEERQKGKTLEELGQKFGVSRQRIQQLLKGHYGTTRIQDLIVEDRMIQELDLSAGKVKRLRRQNLTHPISAGKMSFYSEKEIQRVKHLLDTLWKCPHCGGYKLRSSQVCYKCWQLPQYHFAGERRKAQNARCREYQRRKRGNR